MSEQEDTYLFGFSSGWLARTQYEQQLADPLTPELVPIAEAFKANMMRNRNLGALVPEIAYWTRLYSRFGDFARYRLGRPIEMPGRVRGAAPPDQEFVEELAKVHAEWLAQQPINGTEASSEAWQDGADIVKGWVNSFPNFLGEGIETLMSSKLLELWAAVEALLEDIWTTSLNIAPDPLASNILGNEKSFPIHALKAASFDVSGIMGTLMLRHNKVDMKSLAGVKLAFVTAFSDQDPAEIFARYDPDVAHLEAIRNVFAHRSGLIDERFVSRVSGSEILGDLCIGERLRLNGKIVSHYTEKCANFAADMFVFVDRWIYANR